MPGAKLIKITELRYLIAKSSPQIRTRRTVEE